MRPVAGPGSGVVTIAPRSTILFGGLRRQTLAPSSFPLKVPPAMRIFLLVLGVLSAVLIVAQLVMGQLILSGQAEWVKRHQHSGYLTVVVVIVYIGLSLVTIASMPRRDKV